MPTLVLDKPKGLRLVLDEPTTLQNDPNDVTIRAEESLDVADNLELPLINAEEIADALDGQKLERPGLFKRGIFGLVNKAIVQPFKNIIKGGAIGKLDADLEAITEIRRIKDETGREVSADEFVKIMARSRAKVEKRVQAAVPVLQLPPAKGVAEKGLEIATGLGAFVTKLVVARKFVGGKGVSAEIAAFEVVNQVDDGPPGLGVLLAGSLGLIGKVPAASLGGKGLKLAGQGGALATVTAARGGEPEDIAVAFFLPAILQTFNQFPNLVKGKAWDIKTAKGAEELGIFKGVPIKNIKQWSAAMRDAAKVKMGAMTPKRWGTKHGKNLEDFSNKVGKTYDDVTKITGERAKPTVTKPPAEAVVKAPSKLVKAKPTPKAKIIPIKPEAVEVAPEGKIEIETALKSRGVKEDKLLDALDLFDDLAEKNAEITPDGFVTLYHRTNKANAEKIVKTGKMISKEDRLFFGTHPTGQIEGYGDIAVRVRLPLEILELNDVFPDEAHVTMKSGRIGTAIPIQAEIIAQPVSKPEAVGVAPRFEITKVGDDVAIFDNVSSQSITPYISEAESQEYISLVEQLNKKGFSKNQLDVLKYDSKAGEYILQPRIQFKVEAQPVTKPEAVEVAAEGITQPAEATVEKAKREMVRIPVEDIELFDELRNNTIEFNKKRVSKKRQTEIIERSKELRRELGRKGYKPEFIKAVEMADIGIPFPPLAQPPTVAKAEPTKVMKPKLKPIEEEKRDLLGGVDPLNQIHIALKAAKAVRPITEAAKKETLRKRVGAAKGVLETSLKAGMPAEQAILKSTGMLKGPLTEYDQIYESIEDTLEPGVKNAAYNMIATHPDLKYFEVVGTQKSFQKLLAGSSLTPTEAAQIERVFGKAFEEDLAKVTKKSDLYDRLITYWKATLLTGLKTSGLNILSTAGHAMSETTKDVPAALIDSGISLVTGERKVAFTVKGYPTGWVEGLGKGWRYMKTGYDERNVGEKYDYKRTNFGTSKIARTIQATTDFVFHLLGAEDQPWYYGAYSRSLHSQAIAQAKTKGLKGKEKKDFINNLQKNPTDEMLIWAKEDADTAIYTNRTNLGDLGKAIQKIKGGEVIVPFARTPSAVAMQIINYSPIGIVKEIAHEAHEGKFNQRKFSHAAGRTVVGTAALYLGVQLFKAGLIALGYPKSEKERKLWELEGKKPNSVLIDGKWRGIEALGPTGNLLIIGGYFQQALDSKGSPTEAMIEAMAGGAKSFTEQTFVRGVNLAVDALADPEASFERWFTSMSGSLVPTIVADIARAQDDRARRAVGPKERIQSRIPIYRRGLPPKIDVFGQDLPRYGGNVLETMIDPTRPSKIRQDVVVDELRRLWDKNIKVSPTLLGDKAGYDILTKEENTQLWRRAGELTYKGLLAEINTEGYKKANDFVKGKLLDLVIRNAKAVAKLEIVIIKKAQGKTIMQLAESGLFAVEEFEMLKYFQESEAIKE